MTKSLYFERGFPWVGSLIFGMAVWEWLPTGTIDKIISDIGGPVIETSAIAFGFVITVTTLIITIERRSAIVALKEIGLYRTLLGYLKVAMYSWFFVCGATLILILLDVEPLYLRISVSIWAAVLLLALLSTYRVGRIIFSILSLRNTTGADDSSPARKRIASAGNQ